MSNPTMFKEDLKDYADRWQPVAEEFGLPFPNLNEIVGCGLYGCVFGTEDPKTVLKVTNRYPEAALMDIQSRADFSGVVGVEKVIQVSRHDFLIWRDYLDSCCGKAIHVTVKEHGRFLEEYSKEWNTWLGEYERAESSEEVSEALNNLAAIEGFRDISQGLMDLDASLGIRLEDVHENNLGRYNNYDQLIIFDAEPVVDGGEFPEEILQVH